MSTNGQSIPAHLLHGKNNCSTDSQQRGDYQINPFLSRPCMWLKSKVLTFFDILESRHKHGYGNREIQNRKVYGVKTLKQWGRPLEANKCGVRRKSFHMCVSPPQFRKNSINKSPSSSTSQQGFLYYNVYANIRFIMIA